jgi:hypothetical protein
MYNSSMPGPAQAAAIAAVLIALGFPTPFAVARFSQEPQEQVDVDLTARERVFPGVGAGMKELKRDSVGRYYILAAPAASVSIYAADGKPIGPIPAAPSKDSAIAFAEDIDVDAAGRVYVADRGANAIKIFDVGGRLAISIPIVAPTAVAALPSGEVAVASLRSKHLVTVFDARGKWIRDFGDISDLAEHEQLNRFLNIGHLATDAGGHIYYGFSYLPEPTVRKYDRYGYAASEISLTSLEFQPAALAARREIWRQDQRSGEVSLKPVINALAVEPQTQEVWVALGDRLLQFDRDGNRRGSYRTFTSDGARIEPTAILIEPSRLVLACDPLGIFEFARPDKREKPAKAP